MNTHRQEVEQGQRFEFGANWKLFLGALDDRRIALAEESLRANLGVRNLQGQRFLDIGSGSGLFSLVARRLGAQVHSFDYDPQSVACTRELRQRYFPGDPGWVVAPGSVLDDDYLRTLGQWDVVYSWGVLHHSGDQWRALANASALVADGGTLFIALYNDQGWGSRAWTRTKAAYCAAPVFLKPLVLGLSMVRLWGPTTVKDLLRGRPGATWRAYGKGDGRGMSPWRDVVDWVGGYPFEVSRPEEVFDFLHGRGFQLRKLRTCGGGHGCNEFIFVKAAR
ncbi:MAG: class I SAM-dependent methyltransferase [Ramlibacter sp.]